MKPIERIAAHYQKFTGAGRSYVDVPEWTGDDDKPLRIWWKPVTLRERKRILAAKNEEAEALFLKAEDEAGGRMFGELNDLHILANEASAMVVARVAQAIVAAPTVRDAEKN